MSNLIKHAETELKLAGLFDNTDMKTAIFNLKKYMDMENSIYKE